MLSKFYCGAASAPVLIDERARSSGDAVILLGLTGMGLSYERFLRRLPHAGPTNHILMSVPDTGLTAATRLTLAERACARPTCDAARIVPVSLGSEGAEVLDLLAESASPRFVALRHRIAAVAFHSGYFDARSQTQSPQGTPIWLRSFDDETSTGLSSADAERAETHARSVRLELPRSHVDTWRGRRANGTPWNNPWPPESTNQLHSFLLRVEL